MGANNPLFYFLKNNPTVSLLCFVRLSIFRVRVQVPSGCFVTFLSSNTADAIRRWYGKWPAGAHGRCVSQFTLSCKTINQQHAS